jgi:hypothetical protein
MKSHFQPSADAKTSSHEEDGVKVTTERNSSMIYYTVRGSREAIAAYIEKEKRRYHPAGYGTWFNWPPGGPSKYRVPKEIEVGKVWEAYGTRSVSCD